MKQTVAFIGVGNMGARMARRLIGAGYDVTVCDASALVRQAFREEGVPVAERPVDCARADIIVVMVGDAAQVDEVVCGPDGIDKFDDVTQPSTIVVMSTILPADCTALQERIGRERAHVVDAPVSGGLLGAEQGRLTILAGGEPADIEAAMPVFDVLGSKTFHCGPLGAGQVAKIVNNLIGITNIYGSPEAFELAARHGLPLETLLPILESGSGRNFFTEDAARTRGNYAAWSASPRVFASLGDIIRKDLSLAGALAEQAGIDLPLLKAISQALEQTPEAMRERWQTVGDAAAQQGGT